MKEQINPLTLEPMGRRDAFRAMLGGLLANRSAWLIIASMVLLVGGWRAVVVAQKPKNLGEIATELGSVAEFWREPVPSPSGTKVLFQQSTETGVGMFLGEIPNGSRMLLCEQAERGFDHSNFQLLGWSPDGSRFAYCWRPDRESKRQLIVGDGNTGSALATVLVDRTLEQFAWLTAQAFAYVDDYQELYKVEQLSEERWGRPQPFKRPFLQPDGKPAKRVKLTKEEMKALAPVLSLTASSPNGVTFLQSQALWSWEFGASEPVKLWEATNGTLVDFAMDFRERRFLLHSRDGTEDVFSGYHGPTKRLIELHRHSVLSVLTNRIVWFNGSGHAYVQRGLENNTICVWTNAGADLLRFNFDGGINSYVGHNRHLYVVGSQAGEPIAMWRFTAGEEEFSCIVSNPQAAFVHAIAITPKRECVTNRDGRVLSYRLWSPPKVAPGGRHPLLIGKVGNRWHSYPSAVANGGAYFISIERDNDDGDWGEEVLPILEHLKGRLSVDEAEIYLYAASGFTPKVNGLLENHPGKWRGALLFSPPSFPDPARLGVARLFIDCGGEDFRAEQVQEYRDDAAARGWSVTVALHENAGHVYRSIASLRERDQAVVKFLFGR